MKNRILSLLLIGLACLGLVLPAMAAAAPTSIDVGTVCTVSGVTYMTDRHNRALWQLTDEGTTLVAGRLTPTDNDQRPLTGYRDGALAEAVFGEPWGMVPYLDGLLIADRENNVLRYVDLVKKTVSTYSESGKAVQFDSPVGLAKTADGTIWVSSAAGVTDLAGTKSIDGLSYPMGLCASGDTLYIADTGNHRIVAYEDGATTVVAGAALTGDMAIEGDLLNGPAQQARFSSPAAVLAVGETLYIADTGNGLVRQLANGYVTTANDPLISLISPDTLYIDQSGTLTVCDSFTHIRTPLTEAPPTLAFHDLTDAQAEVVRFATANGLMNGTGGSKFSPDLTLTRGMAVTVLARMDGMDTTVGEEYYTIGLAWALETGISDGTNPTDAITAEQLLTMLYRYAGSPEVPPAPGVADLPSHLATLPQPSDFAVDAYTWADQLAISTDDIAPQAPLTRIQFAEILMQFMLNWQ